MPSPSAGRPDYLRLVDVAKRYEGGAVAVDRVSLDIAQGEIFALLGPSGCGKTTLLRMLAGFETPTAGRILLAGQDLVGRPAYERPINMMFQSYALFPHLTVAENIAFGLKRDGLPRAEVTERVEAMLRLVQLEPFARRKPQQLSGGQQQRVALARSIAKRPQLLLLDEPLGALDKKLREATQIELVRIIREVGVTCVMVTHDQEEAMTMATRIAVMRSGQLLQVGTPGEIYEYPASRFVADFIGNVNLIEGTVRESRTNEAVIDCVDFVHFASGRVAAPSGARVTLALRPEKISLDREAPAGPCNHARAIVEASSYFGSHSLYQLRLASGALLRVSRSNAERQRGAGLAAGDVAWASWTPTAASVLAD